MANINFYQRAASQPYFSKRDFFDIFGPLRANSAMIPQRPFMVPGMAIVTWLQEKNHMLQSTHVWIAVTECRDEVY